MLEYQIVITIRHHHIPPSSRPRAHLVQPRDHILFRRKVCLLLLPSSWLLVRVEPANKGKIAEIRKKARKVCRAPIISAIPVYLHVPTVDSVRSMHQGVAQKKKKIRGEEVMKETGQRGRANVRESKGAATVDAVQYTTLDRPL